jgi:hypothetical protein
LKSKNLVIISVWSAITIIFAFLITFGAFYSDNPMQWLLWMFDDWWIVFLISLIFTGVVVYFIKEPDANMQSQLQAIAKQLDSVSEEVAEIRKAIED